MTGWLVVALVIGALLPIVAAVAIVFFGAIRRDPGSLPAAVSFGKGIALGALGGLAVSAVTIGIALGIAQLRDR